MGKQSQLLLQPNEVELGLQVGVEFDKIISEEIQCYQNDSELLYMVNVAGKLNSHSYDEVSKSGNNQG